MYTWITTFINQGDWKLRFQMSAHYIQSALMQHIPEDAKARPHECSHSVTVTDVYILSLRDEVGNDSRVSKLCR